MTKPILVPAQDDSTSDETISLQDAIESTINRYIMLLAKGEPSLAKQQERLVWVSCLNKAVSVRSPSLRSVAKTTNDSSGPAQPHSDRPELRHTSKQIGAIINLRTSRPYFHEAFVLPF